MHYEEFIAAWRRAMHESGLRRMGQLDEETLDLHSMNRKYSVYVEPEGKQDADPFFVTAKLFWHWNSLQSARTATSEGDMLTQLLGSKRAQKARTERRWLRVDIELHATLPWGKPLPMPPEALWSEWEREVVVRLERIERLVPDKIYTKGKGKDGRLAVLAWQGEPSVKMKCNPGGELLVEGVEFAAWQAINLPRDDEDSSRKPDPHPHKQLAAMFKRVKASLHGWMEAMDHLAPEIRKSPSAGAPKGRF